MSLIVFAAWNVTERVWTALGSDAEVSAMAGYYARVLSLAIPGIVAFRQVSQFFFAQRILAPEVNSASFGLITNLVFGLIFVLGWPFQGVGGYGFTACPVVTTIVTYVQLATLLIVYVGIKKLHKNCWGGWNFTEVSWTRIKAYCALYFPAALALASDFWRVGVIGAIAAELGEAEVAVFNTSYRIMWIALILVGALSGASSINMSLRLGALDPDGAKQAGYVGITMSITVLVVLSSAILFNSRLFGMIFTDDEEFLDLFERSSLPFTITLFCMNLAVALERIPYSMGRTKAVFVMGLVGSWAGQVPAVILATKYWRDDLFGLYSGMAIGYGLLVILYGAIVLRR